MENKAFEAAINVLYEALQMPMADRKGQSPLIAYLDDAGTDCGAISG